MRCTTCAADRNAVFIVPRGKYVNDGVSEAVRVVEAFSFQGRLDREGGATVSYDYGVRVNAA